VIPWDFIWVEGGKGKRTENRYRPVSVSFYLPFPNCCGPLRGRDVASPFISPFLTAVDRYGGGTFHCPDQTLSGERVSWAFHISRRIQEISGGGLGTRIGPTGALLFAGAGGERSTAVLPGPGSYCS
jgi:hypothetical protein